MTASGIKFWERTARLSHRTAPVPRRRRRRRLPSSIPLFPTEPAPSTRRRETWKHYAAILFWTLVVLGGWSLWNRLVWGWW